MISSGLRIVKGFWTLAVVMGGIAGRHTNEMAVTSMPWIWRRKAS